ERGADEVEAHDPLQLGRQAAEELLRLSTRADRFCDGQERLESRGEGGNLGGGVAAGLGGELVVLRHSQRRGAVRSQDGRCHLTNSRPGVRSRAEWRLRSARACEVLWHTRRLAGAPVAGRGIYGFVEDGRAGAGRRRGAKS